MPVTINGDGNITGLSVGGLGTGIVNTATLADGAVTGVKHGAGSIIQVVQAVETGTQSKPANSAWHDISGMAVTITPSSSSNKILLTTTMTLAGTAGEYGVQLMLLRNSTKINTNASNVGNRESVTLGFITDNSAGKISEGQPTCHSFLDSPGLTSAITYKWQWRDNNHAQAIYLNRGVSDNDTTNSFRTQSQIIAMEVAG